MDGKLYTGSDAPEEIMGHHSLFSSSASATTLLPGQDKPDPSVQISGAPEFVVSCGFKLSG